MTNTTHHNPKSSTPPTARPTTPWRTTNTTAALTKPLHLGHRPSSLSNPPAFDMLCLNLKQNAVLSLKNSCASQTGAEHV